MAPSLFLALRYLRLRQKDRFVSVVAGFSLVGLTLGVAALIVVMAVMNGFRAQLMNRILGINSHVSVYFAPHTQDSSAAAVALREREVGALLKSARGVDSVFPVVEGHAMVLGQGRAFGGLVRGVDADTFTHRPFLKDSIIAGGVDDLVAGRVFLGERLAQRLGVWVGDPVTFVSPKPAQTAFGGLPVFQSFPVGGIVRFGMSEYDQTLVFMDLGRARQFLNVGQSVSGFEVFLKDPELAPQFLEEQGPSLRAQGAGAFSWQQANESFFSVVKVERNVMTLILGLIVMVAAFNIVACLVMLVKDKSRDIGILRAMGCAKGMVASIFMWVGLLLGGLGTFLGGLLGVLVAWQIEPIRRFFEGLTGASLFSEEFYFLSQIPALLIWSDVFWVVGVSVVVALVASLYPARRAAALMPHKALRFE